MQGNTLKAIYSRLSDFKPGNVRQLKPGFLAEANNVVNKSSAAGGARWPMLLVSSSIKAYMGCAVVFVLLTAYQYSRAYPLSKY